VKKIQEGKVIFKANLSGKDKGPGKIKGVFYNPSMKLSRDLHVEFAKQFNFRGILLDGMAASGIRGMRLMLESDIRVEFCDSSELAINTIKENLEANDLKTNVYHNNIEDHLKEKKYEWIDIDPFGTPAPYLESAVDSVKIDGILGISATDTAVLCGAKPSICKKRYGAMSMRGIAAKEVGVRILLGKIHSIASKKGKAIEPLLSYSEGHHLRTFVKVIENNDYRLKWLTEKMEIVSKEQKKAAGPLWGEKIIDKRLVPEYNDGKLGKMINMLREEADGPPGLHDINDMAREALIGQTPKRQKIIESLRNLGVFASSSVFSPLGIKTNATKETRIKAAKLAQSL
tara:strand:+ start:2160 stop:3191 length:1032 start_codon:yes stop_codon:yes gene_type:complete